MEEQLGKPEGEVGELVEQFYNSPLFQHMQGLANQRPEEMLAAERVRAMQGRSAADNATVRTVYIVGPDKQIKAQLHYPMTTGRNFDEILRMVDSMQLTAKHKVATPADWQPGEDVIIAGSVSDDEAKQKYPQGWKAPKPYLRIVSQPK